MVERLKARVRALTERSPRLSFVLAVYRRFSEIHGGYLAAAVTMAAFLSLFPLILVAIAVIGFFSTGSPDLADDVIDALGLQASDDAARAVAAAVDQAEQSKAAASIVGVVGLLWSGLGLVAALEYAYNAVWQVTGRGWKDKAIGLGWLVGAGLLFAASFAVTALIGVLPGFLAPLGLLVGVNLSVGLFLWSSQVLCNRNVGWRPLVPGAVAGAVGLEVLKVVGGIFVPRAVASSSALYGSIGVVFAILAWLFFFGRLVVGAAVVNVVAWERRHGTVTVELEAPRLPGSVPIQATRAGETEEAPPSVV